jgi:hypothetical protein
VLTQLDLATDRIDLWVTGGERPIVLKNPATTGDARFFGVFRPSAE